jgi:hypothetical protein
MFGNEMSKINLLENCLSGVSEEACISRIDSSLTMPDILLPACLLFMTIAAIGSVLELSTKRRGDSGFFKFTAALALSGYLAFIPIGVYSLEVFNAESETIKTFKNLSWFHHIYELGNIKNT